MKIKKNLKTQEFIYAKEMKVGDMMVIQTDDPYIEQYNGEVLLKTYSEYVTLDNPRNTWGNQQIQKHCEFKGRKLEPGESVTLIQE